MDITTLLQMAGWFLAILFGAWGYRIKTLAPIETRLDKGKKIIEAEQLEAFTQKVQRLERVESDYHSLKTAQDTMRDRFDKELDLLREKNEQITENNQHLRALVAQSDQQVNILKLEQNRLTKEVAKLQDQNEKTKKELLELRDYTVKVERERDIAVAQYGAVSNLIERIQINVVTEDKDSLSPSVSQT